MNTYYNRTMSDELIKHIQDELPWLIDFVKSKKCLDFQTGRDPKANRSWFSIYRGTSRILSVKCSRNGRLIYDAAESYKELMPKGFLEKPAQEDFETYLTKINESGLFDKWYRDQKDNRNEGYYQTLIGRRYTFELKPSDNFVIIDKEMVIGFMSQDSKDDWNNEIREKLRGKIDQYRKAYKEKYTGRLPEEIKDHYGEFDFLALDKAGNLIIMELKQNDPQKTALSPFQTAYYQMQLEKLIKEDAEFYENIRKMLEQKMELGLIDKCFKIPEKLTGKIIPCVIVGEEYDSKGKRLLSPEQCNRFELAREIALPEMKAYTCTSATDGTIIESKLLNQ